MAIKVKKMTTYEISDSGEAVTLNLVDDNGQPTSLRFQIPELGNLSMTLPALIEGALRRRHRAGSFRFAYPMGSWSIEQALDPSSLIVTLETSDGFGISFSMERDRAIELSLSLSGADERPAAPLPH